MTAFFVDVCPQCGNLKSVCSDPEVTWYPQRSYCYATATVRLMDRKTDKRYPHSGRGSDELHETDGLKWSASLHDLTPDDDFFGVGDLLARSQALRGNSQGDDGGQSGEH